MDRTSMSAKQRTRTEKPPRPFGLQEKCRGAALKSLTVDPLRSALFALRRGIFPRNAVHAVIVTTT